MPSKGEVVQELRMPQRDELHLHVQHSHLLPSFLGTVCAVAGMGGGWKNRQKTRRAQETAESSAAEQEGDTFLFFPRLEKTTETRSRSATAVRVWQAGQSPGAARRMKRARWKNTLYGLGREQAFIFNPRGRWQL